MTDQVTFKEENYKIGLIDKIKIRLLGHSKVGEYNFDGDPNRVLEIYAFKCPNHGIVASHPHGYYNVLLCPTCMKELLKESSSQKP